MLAVGLAAVGFTFDPQGGGGAGPHAVEQAATFDWAPDNALAVGGNAAVNNFSTGQGSAEFATFLQTTLANVFDINNKSVKPGGLASQYEVTLVARIPEKVTGVLAVSGGTVATFAPPAAGESYLEIYVDSSPDADPLSGTGYNDWNDTDAKLILVAEMRDMTALFLKGNATHSLDGFGSNNYPLLSTHTGTGSFNLTANVTSVDADYFPDLRPNTALALALAFNGNLTTPFEDVDPAARFLATTTGTASGAEPILAGAGAHEHGVYGIGQVNGDAIDGDGGPSFQEQFDANSSFLRADSAAIGDFVWLDQNKNGIQDDTEPGVAGVTVHLYDCTTNKKLDTTTTSVVGAYQFIGLLPGDYHVEFELPEGYAFTTQGAPGSTDGNDSDADPDPLSATFGQTACTTLDSGETDLTWDAGILPAAIGDFVWLDQNSNGMQDDAEPGVASVTVHLYDCTTNALVDTTTTSANGEYGFSGLLPGNYHVEFELPEGYAFTTQGAPGSTDGNDSDADPDPSSATFGQTACTTLDSGETDLSWDAGILPAAIGDFVWLDQNSNGIQDDAEPGVASVTVHLYDCTTNVLVDTTTTSANGEYGFSGLLPGNYHVAFELPEGYALTSQNAGADDRDSDVDPDPLSATFGQTACTTLDSGETDLSWDAGILPAAIGDFVWLDQNSNGIQDDAEPGVASVTVHLYDCTTNVLVDTTTTSANGEYGFSGLLPGNYHVEFELPEGYAFTTQGAPGSTDGNDSDADPDPLSATFGQTACTTLDSGETDLSWDAGVLPAAIGDFVWLDQNRNGVQDGLEPGIDGLTVNLYTCADELVDTTTTGGDGEYLFAGLLPGDYYVKFVLPAGHVFTAQDADDGNADPDDRDSDADPDPLSATFGQTACTTLDSGETDLSWDAGIFRSSGQPPMTGIEIDKLVSISRAEGLTPGFWKTHSEYGPAPLSGWPETGYAPDDSYEAIFLDVTLPGDDDPTLLEALGTSGGGINALLRHSAAALLNASNPNIAYAYSVEEVIAMTVAAINGTIDLESTKDTFDFENNRGADLATIDFEDADAPTGPTATVGDIITFRFEVRNTGDAPLADVEVTDDNATPDDLTDDFKPGYVEGDMDEDGLLDIGETWIYSHSITAVELGQFANIAEVTGTPISAEGVSLSEVSDDDVANWLVVAHGTSDKDPHDCDKPGQKPKDGGGHEEKGSGKGDKDRKNDCDKPGQKQKDGYGKQKEDFGKGDKDSNHDFDRFQQLKDGVGRNEKDVDRIMFEIGARRGKH